MSETNEKNTKERKLILVVVFTIIGIGVTLAVFWIVEEARIQNVDKILGYNKDGYFCKGVNIDRYFPLEDCKKSINNSGKTVEEVEAEGTI